MKSKAAVRQAFDFLPAGFTSAEQFRSKDKATELENLANALVESVQA